MNFKPQLLLLIALFLVACDRQEQPEPSQSGVSEIDSNQINRPQQPQIDLPVTLFTNATFYTVNQSQPTAEAMAVQDGKILAMGTKQQLEQQFIGAETRNLSGATVVPGFIDAHGHLLGLGESLLNVDLMGTRNKEEIIQRLKEKAKGLSAGQWLLGRGWDQNDWPETSLPTKADLDEAFPDRPVWLERVDGHANWGNSAALAFSERDLSGDWQIDGGEIVRDGSGQATGVFIDKAVGLIASKVPSASDEQLLNALTIAMRKTAEVGLTSMHDAGTSLRVWRLLEQLQAKGEMNVRVYAMADGDNEMLGFLCENGVQQTVDGTLVAKSVKLYSDGALGSRGAALLEEYSDDPGNLGLLIEPEEVLTQQAVKAAKCGLQVNIHAIGDRGNRVTLNVLRAASQSNTQNQGRHRIEHSQVIESADFDSFKSLGIIASVQPTHATSDMYWAEDRVGAKRIKGAYAWQTFREKGIPLALGSDFPVERPDPLHGFYAAITRQDHKGWPKEGWYAAQKLSREDALFGFTLGAAYAAFQEQSLGSLEVGKYADFTVLTKDIMRVPVDDILNTKIVATYIGGKAVFTQAQ